MLGEFRPGVPRQLCKQRRLRDNKTGESVTVSSEVSLSRRRRCRGRVCIAGENTSSRRRRWRGGKLSNNRRRVFCRRVGGTEDGGLVPTITL